MLFIVSIVSVSVYAVRLLKSGVAGLSLYFLQSPDKTIQVHCANYLLVNIKLPSTHSRSAGQHSTGHGHLPMPDTPLIALSVRSLSHA